MTGKELELDNAFWRFSRSVHTGEGVKDVRLAVQDVLNGDDNVLLFCAWCGIRFGATLDEGALSRLERSVADWNEAVLHPLRAVHRSMRYLPHGKMHIPSHFSEQLVAVESRAEQIAHAILFAQAPRAAARGVGPTEIAAANMLGYMGHLERAAGREEGLIPITPLARAAAAHIR